MIQKKLEICCFSPESAIMAEKFGADRIELCDNYTEGGTTPSWGSIAYLVENLGIPVNVMIRPRGGDFLYSSAEYSIMKRDITAAKELGANGVVFGFLKANGNVDIAKTTEMMEYARPLEVTFHRAFDMCRHPMQALDQLKKTGINRILTSGAEMTAPEGADLLAKLVDEAGDNLSIMPGCGVGPENLKELIDTTGAYEYHSASKKFIESGMKYISPNVSMGGVDEIDEYQKVSVDGTRIKAMAEILSKYDAKS